MAAEDRKSSQETQSGDPERPDKRFDQLRDALRETYSDIQNEPIPESLQSLIDALRKAEEKKQTPD